MAPSRAVTCDGDGYRLRPLRQEDAEALAVFSKDEQYWRYLIEGPRTRAQVRVFVTHAISCTEDPDGTETWWGVDDPETDTFIGTANVKRIGESTDRHGSAGCALAPNAQGQGLGKRLGWNLISLAFERFDFHRLELTCAADNETSFHIMKDVYGFTYEGVRREHALTSRGWWSSHVFSILEDEFQSLKDTKFPVQ